MKGVLVIIGLIALFVFFVFQWVRGIDYMQKHHPDYKGEDLFGEDDSSIINPELYNKIHKKDYKIQNKIVIPEPPFKKFKKWLQNLFS